MSRGARALVWMLALLPGGYLLPPAASGQLLHLDPLPFFAAADSTSRLALMVSAERHEDGKFGWSANRLLVTAVLPAGSAATFFVRMPHTTFDNGGLPLFSRWPWLEPEVTDTRWPDVNRRSSLGQPEIGLTGPMLFSALRQWDIGVALGLPAGSDHVYPFGSASIPLRVEMRRRLEWSSGLHAGLTIGLLKSMGSGKDLLDGDVAFPSGNHLGAEVGLRPGPRTRIVLSYDRHDRAGRLSQQLGLRVWLPWTEVGSVGLDFAHELQGTLDRGAAWRVGLTYRFDSPKHRIGGADTED